MIYFKNNILAYTNGEIPQFPSVRRVIWFVRHGEQIDNDEEKKNIAERAGHFKHGERELKLDNSPLNRRGTLRDKKLENV